MSIPYVGEDQIQTEKDLQIDVDYPSTKQDVEDIPAPTGVQVLTEHEDQVDLALRDQTHDYYSLRAEQEGIAPRGDFLLVVDDMFGLSQVKALDILQEAIQVHQGKAGLKNHLRCLGPLSL